MKLAPGLHRIGNDLVAAYLVDTEEGVLLIDAGLAGQWRELTRELAELDKSLANIRAVLLTHGVSDHIGYAERLRRDHGIPVYVHEADAARARGEVKAPSSFGRFRIGATARFLGYALRKGGMRKSHLQRVETLRGDETLDLPGRPHIIALPGHSPGSIAIHVPAVDAVFVGDALTTRHVLTGENGPQPAPFTDEPDQAIASLEGLRELKASWVLPGHGAPWKGGIRDAVDLVRAGTRPAT